jgi:hypothetical protein
MWRPSPSAPSTRRLALELACRADSAEEFAGDARSWLTDARTELFPELSRCLPATAVLRRQTGDPGGVIGPPGATWAHFDVDLEGPPYQDDTSQLYEPLAWQRTLDTLASVYAFDISFIMMPLDEAGQLVDRHYAAVSARTIRDRHDPRWWQFTMNAPADLVSWHRPRVQEQWVSFVETWAARLDACYGHLTDDADPVLGTALEMATQTPGIDPPTVPRCRDVLRGYSWVTVCAPELAQRLGGARALTASRAFHQVRQLPAGQVLLQATPLLEQYEGAAVGRVFRALAPVLLPGRADRQRAPGARLAFGADAARYQQAAGD